MPWSVNGSPNGDTVREGRPAPTRETGVCVTRATCAPWKGTQFWRSQQQRRDVQGQEKAHSLHSGTPGCQGLPAASRSHRTKVHGPRGP